MKRPIPKCRCFILGYYKLCCIRAVLFIKSELNKLEHIGLSQKELHTTNPLRLVSICVKHGKSLTNGQKDIIKML